MPTIAPAARLENIQRSVYTYVDTNLTTGLSLRVYYEDARPNYAVALPAHWVEVSTMLLSAQTEVMHTSPEGYGALTEYLININVFQQHDAIKAGGDTLYSLAALVETIRDVFTPKDVILVRDYDTGGNPIVGGLTVHRFPSVTTVQPPEGLAVNQKNLSVMTRYWSEVIGA